MFVPLGAAGKCWDRSPSVFLGQHPLLAGMRRKPCIAEHTLLCVLKLLACKSQIWSPQTPAFFLSPDKVGHSISPVLPLCPWLLLGLSLYKGFACFCFAAQQLCFKGTSCLIATYWTLLSDYCKFSEIELRGLSWLVPGRTPAEYFRKSTVF